MKEDNKTSEESMRIFIKMYEIEQNRENSIDNKVTALLAFISTIYTYLFKHVNIFKLFNMAINSGKSNLILSYLMSVTVFFFLNMTTVSLILVLTTSCHEDIEKNFNGNNLEKIINTKRKHNSKKMMWYKNEQLFFLLSVIFLMLYKNFVDM